jgi:hypothetical protein
MRNQRFTIFADADDGACVFAFCDQKYGSGQPAELRFRSRGRVPEVAERSSLSLVRSSRASQSRAQQAGQACDSASSRACRRAYIVCQLLRGALARGTRDPRSAYCSGRVDRWKRVNPGQSGHEPHCAASAMRPKAEMGNGSSGKRCCPSSVSAESTRTRIGLCPH